MKRKCGFTLIEVLVVVAIVALLIAIITPSLQQVREKAGLIACASNQSQIVKAVSGYIAEWNGKLPKPVTARGIPSVLWRQNDKKYNEDVSDAYTSLGSYLPSSNVYNCPLSSFKTTDDVLGGSSYQELYTNPYSTEISDSLDCSYQLLWNYNKFNPALTAGLTNSIPRPFLGTNKRSYNKLIVCELMSFSGQRTGISMQKNSWASPHRFEGASKLNDSHYPFYLREGTSVNDIDTDPDLRQIRLNAGYLDGRVERYVAGDTYKAQYAGRWATVLLPKYGSSGPRPSGRAYLRFSKVVFVFLASFLTGGGFIIQIYYGFPWFLSLVLIAEKCVFLGCFFAFHRIFCIMLSFLTYFCIKIVIY